MTCRDIIDSKPAVNAKAELRPDSPVHCIAALLRFLLNPKGRGWAARGELGRWAAMPLSHSVRR